MPLIAFGNLLRTFDTSYKVMRLSGPKIYIKTGFNIYPYVSASDITMAHAKRLRNQVDYFILYSIIILLYIFIILLSIILFYFYYYYFYFIKNFYIYYYYFIFILVPFLARLRL